MPFIVAVSVDSFWGSFGKPGEVCPVECFLILADPITWGSSRPWAVPIPSHSSDTLKSGAAQVKMLGRRLRWWRNSFHRVASTIPAQSAHKHFHPFKHSPILKKKFFLETKLGTGRESCTQTVCHNLSSRLAPIKMKNSTEALESSFLLSHNHKSPVCQSNHHEEGDGKMGTSSHQPWGKTRWPKDNTHWGTGALTRNSNAFVWASNFLVWFYIRSSLPDNWGWGKVWFAVGRKN